MTTRQAQDLLDSLDQELAAASRRHGRTLAWSATDRATLKLIADAADLIADLERRYSTAEPKLAMRIATELRMSRSALARMLATIRTDIPEPKTGSALKNQRAANIRWERERNASAG